MSGADLGILFVDVLNKSNTPPSENSFEQIATLFSIMRAGTPERETFLHDALRWSVKGTNYKWGHPDFHQKIAQVFWRGKLDTNNELCIFLFLRKKKKFLKFSAADLLRVVFVAEKNYVSAKQHFVYSKDGTSCATMLVELHQERGYSNEIDLFIAQTVLQCVLL